MMDEQFERVLIECLDELQAGTPINSLLARHPEQADTLRPILETAFVLQDVRPAPTSTARVASRRALLNQAAAVRLAANRGRFAFRFATLLFAVFLFILIGSGSIIASAAALPGDTLYGVKQTVEQARLSLASDRTSIEQEIDATRLSEVRQLINAGRTADVRFRGPIESIGDGRIEVAGLTVAISPATRLIGTPHVGRIALIDGQVLGERVDARQVIIQNTNDDPAATALPIATTVPTATMIPTATAMPTATVIPTATPVPTLIPSAAPAAVPTPPTQLPTRAPTATAQPTEQPTALPEPTPNPLPTVGNENGNSNDNGGGSGNDNDNANSNDNGGDSGNDNDNANSNDNSGDSGNDGNSSNDGDNGGNDGNSNSNNNEDNQSGAISNQNDNSNDSGKDENKNENKNDNSNSKP